MYHSVHPPTKFSKRGWAWQDLVFGGWLLGIRGGGGHEKPIYRGDCLKRGGLDSFQMGEGTRGGGFARKRGGVFEGGVDTPMHNIVLYCVLLDPRQ